MPCERGLPRCTTLTSSKPAGLRLASPLPEGATRQPLALYGSMYQSLTEKLGTLTAKRRVGFFRLLTLEFGIALNQAYPAYMAFPVLSLFGRGANEDPCECRVRYEHCQRGGRA